MKIFLGIIIIAFFVFELVSLIATIRKSKKNKVQSIEDDKSSVDKKNS